MIDIQQVWLSEDAVWVRTADGREAYERFSDYPRLKNADRRQLEAFETDGFGISWPELDEDLSFECFFKQKQKNVLYEIFMSFPELNASAVARRTGISQSLFAQYISGTKKPSDKRLKEILAAIGAIGKELEKWLRENH